MNEDLDEFSDMGEQIDITNEAPIQFTNNKFDDEIEEDFPEEINEEIEDSALKPQELKFDDHKVPADQDDWGEDEEIEEKKEVEVKKVIDVKKEVPQQV